MIIEELMSTGPALNNAGMRRGKRSMNESDVYFLTVNSNVQVSEVLLFLHKKSQAH